MSDAGAVSHSDAPSFDVRVPLVPATTYDPGPGVGDWYPPVMIGAPAIGEQLLARGYVEDAIALLEQLTPDDYSIYLLGYYREGLRRFEDRWRYADIVTVLLCLSDVLRPSRYLEIGVRRGRSVAAVAARAPKCSLTMFDLWMPNYAGMGNPGAAFVAGELVRIGHEGDTEFVDGDSRVTLPEYFAKNREATFDLITVDGDHSEEGALFDLETVLPRLAIGGAIVFDDVCHPSHPWLADLWGRLVTSSPRFSSFTFTDSGYGVGFAIRRY